MQIARKLLERDTEQVVEEEITIQLGFDETMQLKKHSILYVETEKSISHGITYHTMDGSHITVRDSLQQVQEVLGEGFLKIHRAIIVNEEAVIGIQGNEVLLLDGNTLPCAVRQKKVIKDILHR